jgi:hypothetical protein
VIKPTSRNANRQNSLHAIKSASRLVAGLSGKYFSNVGVRVMLCPPLRQSLAICSALTPDDGAARMNQDGQPIVPSEVSAHGEAPSAQHGASPVPPGEPVTAWVGIKNRASAWVGAFLHATLSKDLGTFRLKCSDRAGGVKRPQCLCCNALNRRFVL